MFELEVKPAYTLLRLAHGKASALDLEFCRALREGLDRLQAESPPAVVVTGAGAIFSVGVDLLRILQEGEPYIRAFLPALEDMVEAFFSFPHPMVAAVNGHAIAGGAVIALAADRRVMAEGKGRIGVPELRVGVPFPPAVVGVLRFAIPARNRAEVLYGGGTYEGEEARARGFVDAVVPAEELLRWAEREASALGSLPPDAFRLSKELVRRTELAAIRAARKESSEQVLDVWTRPATLRVVRDYVERTFKPRG